MGLTSSRKQAILELVTKLKTDKPVDLERLSAGFSDVEAKAKSAQDRLKLMVGGLKEENIELSKSTQKAIEHSKVLNGVATAADNAQKKLSFYNQAVRNSYSSQNAFLKGTPSVPTATGGASGGKASSALSALGSVLPGQGGDIARAAGNLSRLTEQITQFSQTTGVAYSSVSALNVPIAGLAAGGVAAVALAALAIAIDKFVKEINAAQQTLASATDAQVRYYELIKTGTSAEIELELKRAQIAKDARVAVLQQLEAEQARLGLFGEIAKIFGIGPAKEIERLNKEVEKLR